MDVRVSPNLVAATLVFLCFPVPTIAQSQENHDAINLALQHSISDGMTVTWAAPWADRCMANGALLGLMPVSGTKLVSSRGNIRFITLTCFKGDRRVQETVRVLRPALYVDLTKRPYIAIEVFYGTNRSRSGENNNIEYSGGEWSQSMDYGRAEVSIPDLHRPGELERPVWWKLQFKEDPSKHVMLRSLARTEEQQFYAQLGDAAEESGTGEVFIFVHGFNVEFEDALRRTAQLAFDLRLQSIPVTYSWPSIGSGPFTYTTAENNALKSVDHFKSFIMGIRQNVGISSINVLAHSMGNRIVVDAIHELADGDDGAVLTHLLLAAPDMDADLFVNEIAPALSSSTSTTMYSSKNDKALRVSEEMHGSERAGSLPIVVSGMDTVDSSGVDLGILGHSYYPDHLLQDIFYILHHGLPPTERNLLRKRNQDGVYWALPQ